MMVNTERDDEDARELGHAIHLHLCDLTALVVTPKNRDAVRVPNLDRDEQGDRLQRVVA